MKKTSMKKWFFTSAVTLSFLAGQGTAQAAPHKVVKGDTLWQLGKEHGVTVDELKKVNHRQNDMIYIGETLTIPNHAGVQASSPAIHKVATGDTLFSIAKQYRVTVEGLKAANHLQNDTIYIGQTLALGNGSSTSEVQMSQPAPTQSSAISAEDKDLLSRLVEAEAKGEPYQGKVAVAMVVLNRVASPEFPNSIHDVIYQQLENGGYQFTPVGNGAIDQPASDESKRAVDEALASQNPANDALYFYNPEIATNDWVKTQQVTAVIGNHVFAK
ncbi:cell wall hydrolase [Priestia abyssalis]|uniref:cell wall hydrolase n=1 Tax=Priestia abyssalis TaxID=1221450 RepID=UPI000995A857|nr:cell wall hydrolase [Priestia abyssalis]